MRERSEVDLKQVLSELSKASGEKQVDIVPFTMFEHWL